MATPDLLDAQLGLHATALRLRQQRLDLIASNIANAATPGFKARDMDFRAALAEAQTSSPAGPLSPGAAIKYRLPVQTSLDGNTVELATEQAQFAETAMHYRASLSFLTGRIQTLMTALKGE